MSSEFTLHQARCARHPAREAAARCVSCKGFFCRECATEHQHRILCADCLGREEEVAQKKKNRLASAGRMAALFISFCLVWTLFHTAGRILLNTPPQYHDGSLWERLIIP